MSKPTVAIFDFACCEGCQLQIVNLEEELLDLISVVQPVEWREAISDKADGDFEAHLVALSCSEPPEGFERWSLRLLADKVVELDYIDSISYETVRRVLKKTKLSRGKRKDG
jgi:hypothetical protein